ncbi:MULTISPECIES: response regulator transcription factor [Caulobacter]|jgi:two-component system OmpR family response regulator|uniref:Response regulator with CheY-like receiver domain and winged-helix DNA-binding domain n=1 Tax=Caulobacter vibrioides OR37 TaxID=1292034 RepID=R0CXC7_CAUVI|nr:MULTISPECIES: response regulator transcription factor [Caulobacter]ENZ80985.1 response regulator with CheY-like receiver domain and winged-helix DNA-binding domain [Caulobacter vibrioides OR37]MBQ1559368.1 response regulator transcription factor [Caulobacter sp.]
MKILVVEDDPPLRRSLIATLESEGNVAVCAETGAAALAMASAHGAGFDAIVLDIGLPDIDGFEILGRLRREGVSTPIVILTARDAVRDRIAGLDMGADDYVPKPFDPFELVARVRAVARRKAGYAARTVHVGALACDWDAGCAWVGDRRLDLRPREWAALKALAGRAGRVVERDHLAAEVFPDEETPSPNALDVHVGRLRRKLAPDGPRLSTLRGLGYRLDP